MRLMYGLGLLMALCVTVTLLSNSARCAGPDADVDTVAKAINNFAVDLYPKLGKDGGNLFFAPYSISAALAMTYRGARGDTAVQMAKVLHLPRAQAQLGGAFGALSEQLAQANSTEGGRLDIANALWGQKGFSFLPEYLELVSKNYGGRLNELDFRHQPEAARGTINKWVEEKTENRIVELIPAGVIDGLTRLVLTNAIYFKGLWEHRFDSAQTQNAPFLMPDGEKTEVPMMSQQATFGYLGGEGFQALELPYQGRELSMVVFLPTEIGGLPQFERSVTLTRLEEWLGELSPQGLRVCLPRFKISTPSAKIGQVLSEMGMSDAFTNKADFSGMDGKKDLFLQEVFHKAFVGVNEQGTEAAAATGAVMTLKSFAPSALEFRADHPFMFVIRHNPTKCILFVGRLAKP